MEKETRTWTSNDLIELGERLTREEHHTVDRFAASIALEYARRVARAKRRGVSGPALEHNEAVLLEYLEEVFGEDLDGPEYGNAMWP